MARLCARLRIDGQVDDGIIDGFVRSGAFTGPHGEHQPAPAHRPTHGRLEAQGFRSDFVERLQNRRVVARASDRFCDRLLGHLVPGRHGRRDFRRRHGWGGRRWRRCNNRGRSLFGGSRELW